jgi:hypothetical protein
VVDSVTKGDDWEGTNGCGDEILYLERDELGWLRDMASDHTKPISFGVGVESRQDSSYQTSRTTDHPGFAFPQTLARAGIRSR